MKISKPGIPITGPIRLQYTARIGFGAAVFSALLLVTTGRVAVADDTGPPPPPAADLPTASGASPAKSAGSTAAETRKPAVAVPKPSPAPSVAAATIPEPLLWDFEKPGKFVLSVCRDLRGRVWVGYEDSGVWRYDPAAPEKDRWKQFTTADGLGDDNAYALACDRLGRIWVGHLNHGVSVYNGQEWHNYDVLTGPLGPRIFAIATCPTDGDVWMASDAGLARYSLDKDTWSYFTRAEGLPSDQANALAFNRAGDLFVGTQCDGIAIGRAADGYKAWTAVSGPDRMPNTPGGTGLPINLINCLLVSRKTGTIYAGTTTGLAHSDDNGKTWSYLRGQNWKAKVLGLYQGPKTADFDTHGHILLEDYVTALEEDRAGRLWIGFRQAGIEVVDPVTWQDVAVFKDDYVTALAPASAGSMIVGRYGTGESQDELPPVAVAGGAITAAPGQPASDPRAATPPRPPSPAAPPTEAELNDLSKRVNALQDAMPVGAGAYLGEDWVTEGDEIGRYGREYTVLCAARSPFDHHLVSNIFCKAEGMIGPHHDKGDSLRLWVHWVRTEQQRSLYDPICGYRRQSEWDDHGEFYKQEYEGPDLWVTVTVPAGIHRVSLYDTNKDGHDGSDRHRDYVVSLFPYVDKPEDAALLKPLAQARIHNFWYGVYEQFVVCGPAKYSIRIAKNSSLDTILAAVFIDKLVGPPYWADKLTLAYMGKVAYDPPDPDAPEPPDPHALEKILAERSAHPGSYQALKGPSPTEIQRSHVVSIARRLWSSLDRSFDNTASYPLQQSCRLMAYRAAVAAGAPEKLLENWRWNLKIWKGDDRKRFEDVMKQAHEMMLTIHPDLQGVEF